MAWTKMLNWLATSLITGPPSYKTHSKRCPWIKKAHNLFFLQPIADALTIQNQEILHESDNHNHSFSYYLSVQGIPQLVL